MTRGKNIFDPEVVVPKIKDLKQKIVEVFNRHKKLAIVAGAIAVISVLLVLNMKSSKKNSSGAVAAKSTIVKVNKSLDFPALNNQGKSTKDKIKLTVAATEKTNQVLVNDKVFTAKNNKMFLIVNLELRNDATYSLNILPGDLVRLSVGSDENNKFAPDLHNNLVPIAAISTKLDRIGFVIPQEERNFKLSIGELEGKKEMIEVNFPS